MDDYESRRLVEDANLLCDMLSELIDIAEEDDPNQTALKMLTDICTNVRPLLDTWQVARMAMERMASAIPSTLRPNLPPLYCNLPHHDDAHRQKHEVKGSLTGKIWICENGQQQHVFCREHNPKVCVQCGAPVKKI